MTAVAFDTPARWVQAAQDRGVSQTDSTWSAWMRTPLRGSPSIAGSAMVDLFQAIDDVAAEAALPNWDGEGARPVEATTRVFACRFALALPTGVAKPEVEVDRDGDISFEWFQSSHSVFSVSVRRDGILHYAGLFGPNKINGTEVLFGGLPDAIAQGIRRVKHGI